MESASTRDTIRKVIVYIILIIMAFIMLVPFAWMILTALKTNQEAISVDPFYIFPHNGWHWETFGEVWKISFVAALSMDELQIKKLYPQWNAEARFRMSGVKKIFFYCNRDGLFYMDVIKGIDDKRSGYDDTEERRELEKAAKALFG